MFTVATLGLLCTFCANTGIETPVNQWILSDHVMEPGAADGFDNVAVKDPSIVRYKGQYHLFYTAKSVKEGDTGPEFNIGCGYLHAPSIAELKNADRLLLDTITGCTIIAPQVFYFEPHECWYIIAHTSVEQGNLSVLKPVYLTNPNIEEPEGWSEAKEIVTGRYNQDFWIDFWVICDERQAHLFYANQKGSLFRMSCGLEDFPNGFSNSMPELALHVDHGADNDPWRFFEAAHIYHVRSEGTYLAILEGAYPHPDRRGDVDSRNRFLFGMTADSLDGIWSRIPYGEKHFLAEAGNIQDSENGAVCFTQVSHPELIRSGFNQRLEIEDYKLGMIFQSFDGSQIPNNYQYNELPWELLLIKNH